MNIILMEGDESTQSDGKPRHIYLSIEGKKLILPTDKTILDLLEIGKGIAPQVNNEIGMVTAAKLISEHKLTNENKIELNDIVRYIGPVHPDNPDLVADAEYRVIPNAEGQLGMSNYHIINEKAGVPIRLSVPKNLLVLVRKEPIQKVEKNMVMERLVICPNDGENVALKLDGEIFKGKCLQCGQELSAVKEVLV